MALSSCNVGTAHDQKSGPYVLSWNYLDYLRLFSGCYNALRPFPLAMDGYDIPVYDLQGPSEDMWIGTLSR